jgi:hypothetical protein
MKHEKTVTKRRRRRGRNRARDLETEQPVGDDALVAETEWRWRTFPVLFAFALGGFVMALLIGMLPGAYAVFLTIAVFGVAFGAAHYFARTLRAYRERD